IRLIMRSDVVLPQPEGPTKTVILPDSARRVRESTATVPSGYRLLTDSNSITGNLPGTAVGVRSDLARRPGPTPWAVLTLVSRADIHASANPRPRAAGVPGE